VNSVRSSSDFVQFTDSGPRIPVDLIRSRERGELVFVAGAGLSRGSGLPDFGKLTHTVFERLCGKGIDNQLDIPIAEKEALDKCNYDHALWLLEERIDGGRSSTSFVRDTVAIELSVKPKRLDRHQALLSLGRSPGGPPRVVTTNFDTLLERAWEAQTNEPLQSWAGPAVPAPASLRFTGILHIHGTLPEDRLKKPLPGSELVLTSADFGDAYLRTGWAARFFYDLVRVYDVVLVGYSANDPPLRYLLNVIASDRRRFADLRSIYAFDAAKDETYDSVYADWSAKGIQPITYDHTEGHENLYEALAEWAKWVEDPEAFSLGRYQAISSNAYHESSESERSVMRLLLASPRECDRFLRAGASFSWVKAIEGQRAEGELTGSEYLNCLKVWLKSSLGRRTAVEWAVARLAPRYSYLGDSMGDSSQGEVEPQLESSSVHGFTAEELAVIRRLVNWNTVDVNKPYRHFWHLLLRTADPDPELGSGLLAGLEGERQPDAVDIEQISSHLRPTLRIDRPWLPPEAIEQSETADDLEAVADFSFRWERYPGHEEIVASLPRDTEWLENLIDVLDMEVLRLYQLAPALGWTGKKDRISRWIRVVTWKRNGVDPDRLGGGLHHLLRVLTGAWDLLAERDNRSASRVATRWSVRREDLFRRLYLHALHNDTVGETRLVEQTLLEADDDVFWTWPPDFRLLLVHRWQSLRTEARTQLMDRILAGPPPSPWMEVSDEEREAWRAEDIQQLIAAIATHNTLPGRLTSSYKLWKRRLESATASLHSLVGVEPFGALDYESESSLADDTTQVDLAEETVDWLQVLRKLEEAVNKKALTENIKLQVLAQLADPHTPIPTDAIEAAARCLEALLKGSEDELLDFTEKHERQLLVAWVRLANLTLCEPREPSLSYGPSQGGALVDELARSADGTVAYVGLRFLYFLHRRPDEQLETTPSEQMIASTLERAENDARLLVAANLARWLPFAERMLPELTERLVLQAIERDELVLLDLFALYGQGLTDRLYKRLAPVMLREIKGNLLSASAIEQLAKILTWRCLDLLADPGSFGPDPGEMRLALLRTSEGARSGAAVALGNWLSQDTFVLPAARWQAAGAEFLDRAWPLDIAARTQEVSRTLADIPAILGRDFHIAVEKLAPLLVPFQVWTIDRLFRFPETSASQRRDIAAARWEEALALIDACLGPSPKFTPNDLSDWLESLSEADPAVSDDVRFRRLVRLSQR
jgi:hypothetical protein